MRGHAHNRLFPLEQCELRIRGNNGAFDTRDIYTQGEFEMTAKKSDKAEKRPTANLVEQYRPLGLKAVLAAALQLKPKKKPQTA